MIKTFVWSFLLALILFTAGYFLRNPPGLKKQSYTYNPKPGLVHAILKTSKSSTRRQLDDSARNLREFQYKLRSRIEFYYSSETLEIQYCESLGRLFEEIGKLLQDMETREYPSVYLSQIKAAQESRKRAMIENLKMKSFLARSRSKRRGGNSRLARLEEAVRMLVVHLNGLSTDIFKV